MDAPWAHYRTNVRIYKLDKQQSLYLSPSRPRRQRANAVMGSAGAGRDGDETEALPRLLRHRCRMVQRGVPVTPLQPGFC